MENSIITKAFERISIKEGISMDEVRQEIQKAINEAMQSKDPVI